LYINYDNILSVDNAEVLQKSWNITKGYLETKNRSRSDNSMAKQKEDKKTNNSRQNSTQFEQHKHTNNQG